MESAHPHHGLQTHGAAHVRRYIAVAATAFALAVGLSIVTPSLGRSAVDVSSFAAGFTAGALFGLFLEAYVIPLLVTWRKPRGDA